MKSQKSLQNLFAFGLVALIAATAGCAKKEPAAARPGAPAQQVTVATSKNAWCTLVLVAKSQRYFDDEGLDVNLSIQDAGRYCMDALLSKSAEFGNVVEVNVAYVGFTGNQDVSIIGSVVESASFAVVARKERGISSAKDLKGKTLAFSPGTGGELFAYQYLAHNGLTPGDVQLRKIQPAGIQSAIVSGEVDAAATWEPFIYNCLRELGPNGIALRDPKAYSGYSLIGVRREWAKQNPAAVSAFLRAVRKAEAFVAQNRPQAQAIVAKEIGLDIKTVESLWQYFTFSVAFDAKRVADDTTAVAKVIIETQENFRGKPIPDYAPYFDSSFAAKLQDATK